jgi:signal transduction histidine kinase/ActR/RegA family two-component response regulator
MFHPRPADPDRAEPQPAAAATAATPPPEPATWTVDRIAACTGSVFYERSLDAAQTALHGAVEQVLGPGPRARDHDSWLAAVHPDDRERVAARLAPGRAPGSGDWSDTYRLRRPDGRWVVVHDRGRLIDAGRGEARVVGTLTDLTEARTLRDVTFRSQRLDLVGRVAAGAAHDFNNVLTAIGGFTAALSDAVANDSSAADDLRRIDDLVMRATAITRILQDLGQPRQPADARIVCVAAELDRLWPTVRVLLGSRNILRTEIAPGDHRIVADPVRFEHLVLNMMANARQAMPDGGEVEVRVASERGAVAPGVRLSVLDTGVPPDAPDPLRLGGLDIGGWIVQEMAHALGGTVQAVLRYPRGRQVTVHFPPVLLSAAPRPATPVAADRGATLHGIRILFIEDEPAVQDATRRLLERRGATVRVAFCGDDGLRALHTHRDDLDVVVTDLSVPGLSGPELVRTLRETAPEVACLVVSGDSSGLPSTLHEPGRVEALNKPFELADLLAACVRLAAATAAQRRG